jgi:TPR repeat protein
MDLRLPFIAWTLAVLSAASFAAPATGPADLDAAVKDYRAGNLDAAAARLRPLAELGDPDAAYYLGAIYDRDTYVHRDERQAYLLLARAARARNRSAQSELTWMRERGKVSFLFEMYALPKVERERLAPLHGLAVDGKFDSLSVDDLTRTAVAYCESMGFTKQADGTTPIDRTDDALEWLRRAAEAGQPQAQFLVAIDNLGLQPCYGTKLHFDAPAAAALLRKSASQGVLAAQRILAELEMQPPPGVARDEHDGIELMRQGAARSDPQAIYALALAYAGGHGMAADQGKAMALYRQAAELGHPSAMDVLGDVLSQSETDPAATAESQKWLQRAADIGEPYALFRLASDLPDQDSDHYVKLMTTAASAGFSEAQAIYGVFLLQGPTGRRDVKAGVGWLRSASSNGNATGFYALAVQYENGRNVPRDMGKAMALYTLASQRGNEPSATRLATLKAGASVPSDEVERAQRLARSWRSTTMTPGDWDWRALSTRQTGADAF